jgi:hypothetical protein
VFRERPQREVGHAPLEDVIDDELEDFGVAGGGFNGHVTNVT